MIKDVLRSFFRTLGRIIAYLFIGFLLSLIFGNFKVFASSNINVINSWGGSNNSCTNCSYLNTSNFSGYGYQKSSFIFDEAYIDISFSGILSVQSNNAVNTNISSYMVTLRSSSNDSNITNWCSISYRDESRFEDHFSIAYDIHCSGQVHGNNWNLVIIDFYLNNRVTAGLVSAESFVVQAVTDSSAINSTINNSTNSIINNNNDNTQSVIDNQNKNQQETNEKLDEAEETRKGILQTLIDLPKTLIQWLFGLIVPDNFDFLNGFLESLENKLGFIASVPIQMIDFLINLVNVPFEEMTSITMPGFSVLGYDLWSNIEIDLTDLIDTLSPYKIYTNIGCVCLVIRYLSKLYDNFANGGNS